MRDVNADSCRAAERPCPATATPVETQAVLNPRLPTLRARAGRGVIGVLAAVVAQTLVTPLSAARPAAPAYSVAGLPPPPPVHERTARRESERREGATRLLAGTGLSDLERARLHLQRSSVCLTLGDHAGAIIDMQRVIEYAPKDADFRVMLARALWFAGRDTECAIELEQARKFEPKNRNVVLLTALLAYAREDWSAAAGGFDKHWSSAPAGTTEPYSALYAHLAHARLSGAESAAATAALRFAMDEPLWPRPITEALQGQIAPVVLDELAVHPDPARQRSWRTEVNFYLGERALVRGDRDEAVARFRRVLALGLPAKNEYKIASMRLRGLGVDPAVEPVVLEPDEDPMPGVPVDETFLAAGGADAFDREIHRLIRSGAVSLAIARLRENNTGAMSEERMRMLADLLLDTGQSEEGVAALRATLNGDGGDAPVLTAIGWTELVRAFEHGVDPSASGFGRAMMSVFDPWNSRTRAEGRKYLEAARDAFERARLMRPDDIELVRTNARVLEFVGKKEAALVVWQQILQTLPDDDEAAVRAARLVVNNRPQAAKALLDPVLARDANHGPAHEVMSSYYERLRKTQETRHHAAWAKFGQRLPPKSALPFTPEHERALARIEITVVTHPYGFQYLDVAKTRESTIAGWIADSAGTHTTALLAAALWNPEPDLDKAIVIAREIHRRGQAPLLRTMLEHSGDIVAAGAAARVLAEAGEPDTFPHLQRLLYADQGLRRVGDIAGSMAAGRHIRAGEVLVNLLDPAFESSPRLATDQSAPFAGYTAARARAALALRAFDTDLAQGALEAGVRNPEIALHCRAALFALTREPGHLQAIDSALRFGIFLEMPRTLALLESTGDEQARKLVNACRARKID